MTTLRGFQGASNMKDTLIMYGAAITVSIGFIASWLNYLSQLRVAKINVQKERELQTNEINSRRVDESVKFKLSELENLHSMFSEVALENSLTMSYITSDGELDIEEYRSRYLLLCRRLNEAKSKIAIHFPTMIEETNIVYSKANIYRGSQENLLKLNFKSSPEQYQDQVCKIHDISRDIADLVNSLNNQITEEAVSIHTNLNTLN